VRGNGLPFLCTPSHFQIVQVTHLRAAFVLRIIEVRGFADEPDARAAGFRRDLEADRAGRDASACTRVLGYTSERALLGIA